MKSQKLIYILVLFAVIAGAISCNKNKIMSRDKMVEVLHDIQIAEAVFQNQREHFDDKTSKDALIEGVLKKHGITQAELDSSLVWYSDNVEILIRVNDSVISSLKRESDYLNKLIHENPHKKRYVNFSIIPEFSYLTDAIPTLPFQVDSFEIHSYPDFEIELKTLWMQKDMEADFSVFFVYTDTILAEQQKLVKDGTYKISRPDKKERLKYISGYIHLDSDSENPDRKMFLYDISVRDSIRVAKTDSTTLK